MYVVRVLRMNGEVLHVEHADDALLSSRVDLLRIRYPRQCMEIEPHYTTPRRHTVREILERKRHE